MYFRNLLDRVRRKFERRDYVVLSFCGKPFDVCRIEYNLFRENWLGFFKLIYPCFADSFYESILNQGEFVGSRVARTKYDVRRVSGLELVELFTNYPDLDRMVFDGYRVKRDHIKKDNV